MVWDDGGRRQFCRMGSPEDLCPEPCCVVLRLVVEESTWAAQLAHVVAQLENHLQLLLDCLFSSSQEIVTQLQPVKDSILPYEA
mmetsp:Transcript_73422/g.162164  ORF Transcript_73422/g.162164 Transcript_73422/m.162164 type:complete len:84 (-) Transcript_73422:125-376(-)